MSPCRCIRPSEHPNPRRKGICVRCSGTIDPAWLSSDQTIAAFMARLDGLPDIPRWRRLKLMALNRERQGRELYAHKHLQEDAIQNGREEAADGVNYCHFGTLEGIRLGYPDIAHPLTRAAYFFARAFEELEEAEHERPS